MSEAFHIVVCGGLVPDPLQTLEPITGSSGRPELKGESLLPVVLDPWAAHALYEAAHLAKQGSGKVWLVSLGPKARIQQLMMTLAQKVPFELVALDGPASGFVDSFEVAAELSSAIEGINGLDRSRLLLFGGCASATRDGGATMQMVGERLGIREQFLGVDELRIDADGALHVSERVEGGQHLESVCSGPPAVLAWATGYLPEPPNNPQVGMMNMRTIMPALQRARPAPVGSDDLTFAAVDLPGGRRETRIVKDLPADEVARDIVDWIRGGGE